MSAPPPTSVVPPITAAPDPKLKFTETASKLPIAHLESLRFKCNQIIESIIALQRTIEFYGVSAMPAWPDILSKYNILLSQTHSFSNSLLPVLAAGGTKSDITTNANPNANANPYEKIALHPSSDVNDTILDNEIIPLLRNQQTTDVLRMENDTVRRLAERMQTKGSIGVLSTRPLTAMQRKPEYADVLAECSQIRAHHDARVERAVRAVGMLQEKFEWKARVEVEIEEPEELQWDPRLAQNEDMDADVDGEDNSEEGSGSGASDEEEVEDALNGDGEEGAAGTPGAFGTPNFGSPAPGTPDVMTPNAAQLAAELEGEVDTS